MPEKKAYTAALSKAMALCSRMEYCRDDIRKKLESWGIRSEDENRIIKNLISENFLNEERYSKAFARDKFRYNKWGRLKISAHLKAKKIDDEIIKAALDQIDNEVYINTIKDLIHSHKRTVKAKNEYDLKGKLLRFGSSKGFESSILYDILNDLSV